MSIEILIFTTPMSSVTRHRFVFRNFDVESHSFVTIKLTVKILLSSSVFCSLQLFLNLIFSLEIKKTFSILIIFNFMGQASSRSSAKDTSGLFMKKCNTIKISVYI